MNDSPSSSYDEISFADIFCFCQRQAKLIGSLTLLVTLLGLGFRLSRPSQIRQTLVLSLTTPHIVQEAFLSASKIGISTSPLGESSSDPLANEVAIALEKLVRTKPVSLTSLEHRALYVGEAPTSLPSAQTSVNEQNVVPRTARIDEFSLGILSSEAWVSEQFPPLAVATLESAAQKFIARNLSIAFANLNLKIEESQYVVTSLQESEVALPTTNDTIIDDEIAHTARLKFQRQELLATQGLLDANIRAEILEASQSTMERAIFSITVLSAILGFMASMPIAIFVDQWPRLKQQWRERTEANVHTKL